jgi:hypothetical protein
MWALLAHAVSSSATSACRIELGEMSAAWALFWMEGRPLSGWKGGRCTPHAAIPMIGA